MKKLFLFISLFVSLISFGQSVSQRSNGTSTVNDPRWMSTINLFIPRYADTTAANVQKGIDSCGAIIFTYADSGKVYVRKCFPVKYWAAIGSGGGGGGTVTGGINGTQLIGSNIGLGGSNLIQYSAIGLNGFPLTILHNGVNNAAQSDSNSLMLVNRTVASTTTDSLVTPSLTFSVNGRTAFPSAAVNVKFRIDEISNGTFRIASSLNNAAYSTLFSMNRLGVILNNLNIQSQPIGIPGGTGGSNLSWGASAAISNTTGSQNLAIGVNSMLLNTKGAENTAVGYNTLASNDTAVYNTAIGSWALNSNTSGFANTAVGKNALLFNRTGIKNTAIGAGTMEQTTTGGFNSALGEDALLNNTTGTNNVAMGWLSGALNQIGNGNVSIGFNTGTLVASGDNNTFLGTSAGNISPQEDTLSESIAIGHNSITTASNQMVLGSTNIHQTKIFGSQVGSGTDSLYSRKSDGTLGAIAQSSIVGATPTLQQVTDVGATTTNNITTNGLLINGNALISAATSTGVNDYTAGQYRISSWGANAGTAGIIRFQSLSSDGSITRVPMVIHSNGNVGISNTAPGELLTLGSAGATKGILSMSGNTSGKITIQPADAAGTYILTLPITDGNANEFLQTDGSGVLTWAAVSGTGTVTTVSFTGGLISVANPTTTPAFTVAGTSGGIPYFSSTTTWASSALLTANAIMIGGGAGTAPATTTTGTGVLTALGINVGSAGAFVTFNGALGTPSSGTLTNTTGFILNNIANPTGDWTPTFDVGESITFTNSNTTEDLLTINTSTLTTASLFSLNSTSTALAAGNNLAEFVMSGANGSSSITATAIRASVTNSGTTNTNIAIDATATGGATDNWAVNATGNIKITTANTTQVTTSAGLNVNANSLTNGTGVYIVSSTLQAGTLAQIVSTSTALAANNEGLDIAISGANGTNAITATGIRSTVTNTNATSGTNIAASFTASGATTANIALQTGGGNVLIGSPTNNTVDGVIIQSPTNTAGQGLRIYANNNSTYTELGYGAILNPGGFAIQSSSATVINLVGTTTYIGAATTATSTLGTLSFAPGYVAKTANYTATISDFTINCTANTFTVTLPASTSIIGRIYYIINSGAGTITISTSGGETFLNVTATPTTLSMATVGATGVQATGGGWVRLSSL